MTVYELRKMRTGFGQIAFVSAPQRWLRYKGVELKG